MSTLPNTEGLWKFFQEYVKRVVDSSRADLSSMYTWNKWKESVDPLLTVSETLEVDAEELKRARNAFIDAQTHLKYVAEAQLVKVQQAVLLPKPTGEEDLT